MTGRVLFERQHRGHLWRLEIATFKGRTFANWRKWYRSDDAWKPTRVGCTMPIDCLNDLAVGVTGYLGEAPTS